MSRRVSLERQIATVREEADRAAAYAKACAASHWPLAGARARADALQAAVATLEMVASLQFAASAFVDLGEEAELDEVRA